MKNRTSQNSINNQDNSNTTAQKGEKMTCLVLIITATLIVLAADDAVTLENRIYGGIEKIYELSNDPPISIMIYGNSDFCNIPLENIISEYKKKTDFKKINTVVKVKKDLLKFVNKNLKSQKIEEYINEELKQFKFEIKNDLNNLNMKKIILEKEKIQKIKEFENISLKFEDILPNNLTENELELLNNNLEYAFFENLNENRSGIVIAGIDKKTMKGSYIQFEMILNTEEKVIFEDIDEDIKVNGSKIKIFAQNQVIEGFLNGIDEDLQYEISESIEEYNKKALKQLEENIKEKKILNSSQYKNISNEINSVKNNSIVKYELEDALKNRKIDNFKRISEELDGMSKEELIEMSKTLIDITRLKQIISSERETVGGNVTLLVLSLKNGTEKIY